MLTASIIPRMLGPSLFGDYKFLLYSFTQFTSLIGSGNNFLSVELAKNHYDKILISFYWTFILTSGILASIFLIPILNSNLYTTLFPGQNIFYLWLAFFLTFFIFIAQVLESMTDSCGLTKNGSIVNLLARVISVIFLLLFLFIFNWKNIFSVFSFSYISAFLLIVGFIGVLKIKNIPILYFKISFYDLKQKFNSFYKYSSPLFFLSIVALPLSFLSRWILQTFGGSLQQGYFSLSDSLSSFVITFSNSFIPLLLREFSISFNDKDINHMSSLFNKSISFLFAISSFFSVFLLLNASKATLLLGGKTFEGAILPMSIMLLYPIPYITNNIIYAFIYSTNRTVLLRNVMVISSIFGVLITFILVAPKKYFGLDLGAVGIAISMVFVTSLIYLVLLKYCVSALHLTWRKIIGNHIVVIILFLADGVITVNLCDFCIQNSLISLILSGMIYSLGAILIAKLFPKLLGISTMEVYALILPRLKKVRDSLIS